MSLKSCLMLCSLLAAVCVVSAQGAGTPEQVIFFDNKDYSGNSQDFPVTLPATGCTPCAELNYVKFNSWESYVSSGGSAIILFDGHGCSGKTSGRVPANQGVIQGTLSNSVDSFMLCA